MEFEIFQIQAKELIRQENKLHEVIYLDNFPYKLNRIYTLQFYPPKYYMQGKHFQMRTDYKLLKINSLTIRPNAWAKFYYVFEA